MYTMYTSILFICRPWINRNSTKISNEFSSYIDDILFRKLSNIDCCKQNQPIKVGILHMCDEVNYILMYMQNYFSGLIYSNKILLQWRQQNVANVVYLISVIAVKLKMQHTKIQKRWKIFESWTYEYNSVCQLLVNFCYER